MLTVESLNPDNRLSVTIAIFFAEDALFALKKQHPVNMRSREAIEAAKEWLASSCEDTADAAADAASAAYVAAHTYAYNAKASAAAYYAASAAANAASAAANAASAAANAACAAAYAAMTTYSSAYAASRRLYTHRRLVQLLPHLFEYKLHTKTSFKDSEQVLSLLSEENQQRFLFSPNCMVE